MSGPADDTGRPGPQGLTALPTRLDTTDPALGDLTEDEQVTDVRDASDDEAFLTDEPLDWAWVEEWRNGGEPIPWGPGLALSGFVAFLVASAVYVLCDGLSDHPIVAVGVNVLVAGGLGPALWLSRSLPVLRWIAGGAVLGVLLAWLSVLIFLA